MSEGNKNDNNIETNDNNIETNDVEINDIETNNDNKKINDNKEINDIETDSDNKKNNDKDSDIETDSDTDIDDILNEIKEETIKINNNLNLEFDKQKLDFSKKQFDKHLQDKVDKLGKRLTILQIKYQGYKSWYNKMNIMIIIISTLLSIFEAFRNEMKDLIEGNEALEIFFSMIPIGISSFITCSAAIIKFKKYQEKMENMQFTREKVILSISKIKNIQESIKFSNRDKLEEIKKKYLDDIYSFYNESTSELERHIKYSDHYKLDKVKTDKSNETDEEEGENY